MKRAFSVLLVVGFAFLSVMPLVAAEEILRSAETPAEIVNPVDAGNKICPVSGEKISENLKATYEYNGKIYNFCCTMCIDEFKKDPQKYVKKVEEEVKAAAPAAQDTGAQTAAPHEHHH